MVILTKIQGSDVRNILMKFCLFKNDIKKR